MAENRGAHKLTQCVTADDASERCQASGAVKKHKKQETSSNFHCWQHFALLWCHQH